MKDASKAGKAWINWIFVAAIFICFLADLYFLHDTVDVAFDNEEGSFLSLYCWVIAGGLVLLYILLGMLFGNKLKESIVFRSKWSAFATVIVGAVLIIALFLLTVFRLSAELEAGFFSVFNSFFTYLASNDYVDQISKVFVMTLMMSLSAFISALYAYYRNDVISGKIYTESKAMLASDIALYNKVYFEYSDCIDKERDYELKERELDKKAVDSAFKLGSIASQLNGIVDPADAYEFLEVQRMMKESYFGKEGR